MPNFLENLFAQLNRSSTRVVLREIHGEQFRNVTGAQLLAQIQIAREALRRHNLQPGDRCALLAPNSIRWITIDLALMAEGLIVVPLYSRQAPAELVAVMQDCKPSLLIVGDKSLADAIAQAWPAGSVAQPPQATFEDLLPQAASLVEVSPPPSNPRRDSDLVTIVYTSGTSGEPKGVCLHTGNISFMLSRTAERLDQLMRGSQGSDSIFHYLPLNFAASWIATLSFLSRESVVTLSTDLNKLADEIRLAAPHYFLNVPTLLERVRRGVDDAIAKRPAVIRSLYAKARDASQRQLAANVGARLSASSSASNNPEAPSNAPILDALWLALGRKLIFSKIKERFGPHLRALICGSAPLAPETQDFFLMLGVRVLQVYGLTETTGICTMDDPNGDVDTGHVGPTINGIEMEIGENEEILVRGPNVFPGYWNRQEETARVLQDGWFHTGDQGEKNAHGNWRIIGRVKNLIILNSGHKVPPEPIEDKLAQLLPGAQHIVVVGNGRGYLCALVTGPVEPATVQSALDAVNPDLPHYRQIRNFTILRETLTPDGGLLTAMGKLRRNAINTHFAPQIDALYAPKSPAKPTNRTRP
jgi:long-chain acyl-CoA synthetase